jgi:hypothetical protein
MNLASVPLVPPVGLRLGGTAGDRLRICPANWRRAEGLTKVIYQRLHLHDQRGIRAYGFTDLIPAEALRVLALGTHPKLLASSGLRQDKRKRRIIH